MRVFFVLRGDCRLGQPRGVSAWTFYLLGLEGSYPWAFTLDASFEAVGVRVLVVSQLVEGLNQAGELQDHIPRISLSAAFSLTRAKALTATGTQRSNCSDVFSCMTVPWESVAMVWLGTTQASR